jgi:NADP-dependent 3-hydroxy acid dehydrogenase YdfG
MSATLDGQAALVTGASAGIGRATARALAREGAAVALAARRAERLREIADTLRSEYGAETLVVPTDVREEAAVADLVEATVDAFGGLDLAVSNAGLARGDDVEEMTTEEYRTMMETNVDGTFFTAREALPHLRAANGLLVFIGSLAGEYPRPYNPVYAATKWWTRGFAKSLSAQVGGDVPVTIVNPSEVRTEFVAGSDEPFAERYGEGEAVEPEEVAEAVVFAAEQSPSVVTELDIYQRDKFEMFET